MQQKKCVLKLIRKGAYECGEYLVVFTPWVSERWDGPREQFRGWKVYRSGSAIEKRLLIDAFATRHDAYLFVARQLGCK